MSSRLRRTALAAALATGAASLVAVPPSVADDAHQPPARSVDLTGTLLVVAGEGGEEDAFAVVRPGGQVVPIDPGTNAAFDRDDIGNGHFSGRVRLPVVHGRSTTLRSAVASGTALPVESATIAPRPTTQAPATHRIAIALTNNLGAYQRDTAALRAAITGAADFWVDQSDGQIPTFDIATEFVPYNTTTTSVAAGCGVAGDQTTSPDFAAVTAEASTLFPGHDFVNGNDHLIVLMPDTCLEAGPFAGRASGGQSLSSGGVQVAISAANLRETIAHELGHNFGLRHATSPDNEYGNIYEVMGAGPSGTPPELGTSFRHEQGLIQAGEVVSLTGQSGSSALYDRARTAETGVRGIEVIDPDNGARLWFDLRTATGSDAGAAYGGDFTVYGRRYRTAGVVIEQDTGRGSRMLLPGGNTALSAGETWSNSSGSMRVGVSSLDAAGGVASLSSTYAPGAAVSGGSASIGGSYQPFQTARAIGTGFSPAPNGLRYQWFANGSPIPHEEEAEFVIPLSLVGAKLSVQVTAYAAGRAPSAPVMSAPITVAPATFYVALGTSTRPTISGTPRTGQVLSTTGLAWIGYNNVAPPGFSSTFQWYSGAKAIKGATSSTYRVRPGDLRKPIYVRNLATAPGFEAGRAQSSGTAKVKKGTLPSAKPRIKFKGKKATVGSRLKAKPGGWLKKTRLRYQWYAGKRAIKRATKRTFRVPRSLKRKKISVKVTGTKKGYKRTSRRSAKVKIR